MELDKDARKAAINKVRDLDKNESWYMEGGSLYYNIPETLDRYIDEAINAYLAALPSVVGDAQQVGGSNADTALQISSEFDPAFTWQEQAVNAIEHDIGDRRGIKHIFNEIDEEVKKEIHNTWVEIIRKAALPAEAKQTASGDVVHLIRNIERAIDLALNAKHYQSTMVELTVGEGKAIVNALSVLNGQGWREENAGLLSLLKGIESHHEQLNRLKGRPEENSKTLRLVRQAIAHVEPPIHKD